ncbi:MAG: PKD domain-containing protein [Chitinophagaceae bacterium]|nr:PKD domain-containing protein [Chitinophagaceae bacterium]
MRKFLLLAITVFAVTVVSAQDFSNKGKDFWVGYGYHERMNAATPAGGSQDMVLYFATDRVTNITVSIPALGYTQNLTSPAGNNVLTSAAIPKSGPDARLTTEGISDNGVHITSDQPMVAYAHIYNSNVSGATILFPKNTLGKEYYSINYTNNSNTANANCWFYVVATDTGTTTIEITPRSSTQPGVITTGGWVNGTTYTVNLTQGQIYNVMGVLTGGGGPGAPFTGVDLTGSKVKSIASGSGGCKKIAVFSGSGRIGIRCNAGAGTSSDNYMVQSLPQTAWGKKYLTVPASGGQSFNIFRVCVSDPTTVVKINGVVTGLPLIDGFYYQIPQTNQPQLIEADKSITVAQYFTSQSQCGNGNPGDPEVIYLSSVEQNIDKILWNATPNFLILGHYLNVVIPNGGTAISSFRLDGGPVPPALFVTHPQDAAYSYLQMPVGAGPHIALSDSGFNAIAYGFGSAESYGYNAGTNVKDLSQALELETTYGIETSPSVCTNAPFKFKVYFPDSTLSAVPVAIRFDSLNWRLASGATIVPNNFPILVPGSGVPPYVPIDSVNVRGGRQVAWYSLPTTYYFNAAGNDTLLITGYRSTNEGCGTTIDYEFPIVISDPPTASFTAPAPGCYLEQVVATETTPQLPKPTYKQWWEFYDPVTTTTTVYTGNGLRVATHTFTTPGIKQIRHASITTPGCLSDTIVQTVNLPDIPDATIAGNTTVCINTAQPTVTFTGSLGTAEYIFSYTINGGPVLNTVPSVAGVATILAPTNVAGTFIYNLVSVRNAVPVGTPCVRPITGQSVTITITPDATVTLSSLPPTGNQTVCINTPITNITYAVGGSGNAGSVTGLPTGVTGTFAGGVITITGTPTVSGVYPYTVTATGPCLPATANGTITVTADATIALTSAAGSDNQTLCINTPLLVNITYAVGGSGTGVTFTGLPAGVNGVYAGGVVTISGTPSVAGVFPYTVNTTGPCVIPSASGTITVTGDGTLTLTSAAGTDNQSLCINVPITNITYAVGGTGTGGSVSGLPPGVTGVFAGGVITISGTPTSTAGSPYIYTVTTTGPCVIPTTTGTITVNPDASIVLTSAAPTTSQELCRNSTITNITYAISGGGTGATFAGLPAGVTGVYAAGVVTISGSPTVAGLFNYTVTTTGTCVQNSLGGSILVNQLPTANFTYTAPSCETRVIDFTDASVPNVGVLTNWTWDFGDGPPTSPLQNPSHVYAAAGIYNVTLTVTTDKGCVSNPIASIPVTISDRPLAGFSTPEGCLSDTYAQFLDTSKVAVGTITGWLWDFGDPFATIPNPNTSTLQNPTHSYTAVGPYTVTLVVTTNNGCKDTIVQALFVNGSFPVANFNVNNPATLCANDSVGIVEASTVFPGTITKIEIYWDNVNFPAVFDIDNSPFTGKVYRHLYPNFQAPLTRTFTIRYRAYSGGVCVNDKLADIVVNAAPLVQFNNMPNSCLLVPPFQITQASEIGGVPGTGTYSGPGVSPTGLFTPQVAGIGTHTILYTFTSTAAGCVDTMSNTITVLDTAQALFSHVTPSCEQVPTSFTDLSVAPATVVLANTVWDFGDGTPVENHAPGATFGHVFALPGTYTVTMYNVSTDGCNSTVTTQNVTIDANHIITLNTANNNQTVCINNAIVPIQYTLSGGATDATVTGLPAGVNASVAANILTISGTPSPLAGGPAFPYSITTTGNTCVVATASGVITVEPDHTIAFSSGDTMQSVCVNTPIDPIVYTLGGGASGVTIAGLPAGVTYAVAGNTLTISGTPTATGGPSYPYVITTTGNSCVKANADGEILVNPYPVPFFTPDQSGYCIPNAVVKFNNSSTMPDLSGMTYNWNFGETLSSTNTSTAVSPTHWYSSQGPFDVTLTATSTAVLNGGIIGCVKTIIIPLTTIHPQPKVDFVFNKPSVCIGDNVVITDATDGKDGLVNQWFWDLGDGSKSVINPVTVTYTDTISYDITLYTINTYGCNSDTITKQFTVYPYPKVNAGPDRFVLEGGQIQLETVTYAVNPSYTWTPGTYLTDPGIPRPWVIKPKTDMTYRLTVTGKGGCQLSDDVFVQLRKFPVIPNTFTPNNDGINDLWKIDFLNTYPDNRVQIFTRTGKLVFESLGYNTPWDGKLKGKPLPFDTYYYIIEPGSGRDPITGYVTILK